MSYAISRRLRLFGAFMALLAAYLLMPGLVFAQGVDNPVLPPGDATAIQNWEFIAALLVGVVVPVFSKERWADWQKSVVMLATAAIVTVLGRYLTNTLDSEAPFLEDLLTIVVATIAYYYGVIKPLGVSGAIHRATGG